MLRRNWRVRPSTVLPEHQIGPLELRPLEERRVLSAGAALALAQALAASGMEQVEGASKSPDPATPLGTDTAHQEPIDPGNNRHVESGSDDQGSQAGGTKGPAAENLDESENRTAGNAADVQPQVATSLASEDVALTLVVAGNQTVDEGTQLALPDIGQFTDAPTEEPAYTYTINWGDGTPVDSGPATIDFFGGDGLPTQGSFDGAHTYADNGVYTVTVTVSSQQEAVAGGQFTVTVQNVAPVLTVAPDQATTEGAVLTVTNIGQFTDPGFDNPLNVGGETSEKFTYAIDWGDGTPVDSGPATIDVAGGPGVPTQGSFDGSHVYADNGLYTVTVTILDDDGGSAAGTFDVRVQNVAPTLTVAPDQSTTEGALLSITNIGQFSDPGFNNPLNVGGETSEKFTYAIDWGDGTNVDSGPPTIDVPGGVGVPTQGSFDGSHVYADNGTYTVTVTVNDDDGGKASGTFTVVVQNVAPVLTVAPDQMVNEGSLLSITNIGQFTDPGFDNPKNVGGEVTEKFTYAIDWGDGTPVDSGPATIDVPGGPGVPTQGSFDGSHIYADNGVYTVTVTISDDDGGTAVQTFSVAVKNVAPSLTVVPDQVVDEGSLLSITNIGQFTDPGFDNPLNVGGEVSEKFTYAINWGDGTFVDSGAPTIDVPGGPGVLTQGSFDGSHIYADNGTYTVTVTVSDDDGGKATQTFDVTVHNVAPSLIAAPDQVTSEGSLLSVTNIGVFTDPGYDNPLNPMGEVSETFTYSIDWGDGTPADTGPATIDVPGGPGVPTQGSFDGSHIYADNGSYTVTISVMDDDGGVTATTLTVHVTNVAPTLVVPGDQTVDEGALLSLPDIGVYTDPGFDNPLNVGGEMTERFTFAINWGDGSPIDSGPATIDVPGGPGMLTQGSFNGQHTYTTAGVYNVTVTVSDDDGGSTSDTFQVTVNSVAPILVTAPNQVTQEGALLSVTNIGQFIDPHPGGAASYTYSIDWGDGRPLDVGPATIDASGEEGPTAGSFDGAHIYADNGLYTVVVTITAADGRSASASLNVAVQNVAPTLVVGGDVNVPLGTTLVVNNVGQFTDPGFDNPLNVGGETTERFTFAVNWADGTPLSSGPATIDGPGSNGVRTAGSFDAQHLFAAPGIYHVTVSVADDDGGVAVGSFTVTVFVLRPPPEALFFPPGGGGGTNPPPNPPSASPGAVPAPPNQISRVEFRRARIGSVAGAEPRLVLRIVSPDGIEDRLHDEPLGDDVLDNLQGLFRRLPDGRYRVYLIQPDGVERLVVDVLVEQGRRIELEDEPADDAPPVENLDAALPAAERNNEVAAPANDSDGAAMPAVEGDNAAPEAAAPGPMDGALRLHKQVPPLEVDEPKSASAAMGVAGGLAVALPPRAIRLLRSGKIEPPVPLTKTGRLLRRLRSGPSC